jgi:DNA-binding SARP family transcriptional activator
VLERGRVSVGVLGPVAAWDADGAALDLRGPRHRAVLARLAVARGRVVPLAVLIEDLWDSPPAGAVGAIRTFVSALRRAIEPDRSGFQILMTQGPGYVLRAETLDALRFGELAGAAGAEAAGGRALRLCDEALALWRGPAYAEFAAEPWAEAERARLTELRLGVVERQAQARLALGLAAQAVPDLQAHVTGHPWREDAWRLLALALYRSGRQAEALEVIRRAKSLLATELGLDPGPAVHALEVGILRHDPSLNSNPVAGDVWAVTAAAYQRVSPAFTRTRLEAAATLAGSLAVGGGSGLEMAMSQRLAAIEAAEELGDPALTARVIGNFDVPAIWPRSDDPVTAARIVAEAVAIARRLGDPALLAFALNGGWMQSFWRTGLAARRDLIGAEIVALATRHDLANFEILGRLIRLQALSGLGDFAGADGQAARLDQLGEVHERPLVGVFTNWHRAMRAAATRPDASTAEEGYRRAARRMEGCGMPGVESGLLPLALLCLRVWLRRPADFPVGTDWGPYGAWASPWLLLARGRDAEARQALRDCPAPPPGLLAEALWCLTARAAVVVGDRATARRAHDALRPAAGEIAGASSGMLTAGPVDDYLAELRGYHPEDAE